MEDETGETDQFSNVQLAEALQSPEELHKDGRRSRRINNGTSEERDQLEKLLQKMMEKGCSVLKATCDLCRWAERAVVGHMSGLKGATAL